MVEGAQGFGNGAEQLQGFAKGYTPSMTSVTQDGAFYRGAFDPSQSLAGDIESLGSEPIDEYEMAPCLLAAIADLRYSYYREMHTYFPILANSRDQFQLLLGRVRPQIRDVLLQAINAAINTSRKIVDNRHLESIAAQLSRLQIEDAKTRSVQDNVVFLQALVFMIIAVECAGPGENDPVLWYGVASGFATFLKLHLNEEVTANDIPDDIEIKTHGRRAFLVLAMMDRWHAASMVVPTTIPDEQVVILPNDQLLLGDSAYHLVRKFIFIIKMANSH